MFATTCSASEDIRKHVRAGGTHVPQRHFLVLLVHSPKKISDIYEEMKIFRKQLLTY